jgi:hypothetical protein
MDTEVITHDFIIDLSLIGMAAINATRRVRYVNRRIVGTMPHAAVASGKLHFFPTTREMSAQELPLEADKYGLILANPYILAGFVSANQDFADSYPVATQWWGKNGAPCYFIASRWIAERRVGVGQVKNNWHAHWFIAGVDKPTLASG